MTRVDPVAVAHAPKRSGLVVGYRNQGLRYDPRSGDGARRNGGRFNPPGSFPVVYLCSTPQCAAAELVRQAFRQGLQPGDLLPRKLWRLEAELGPILDLTDDGTLAHLGISSSELVSDNLQTTRQLGEAAYEHRYQAIQAPSAADVDVVIAVFPENLGTALLDTRLIATWRVPGDLST